MTKLAHIFRNAMLIQVLFASSICLAKTDPEVQFLNTYDQLTSVIGQAGHWFVRDAANTGTGQHGDPTVNKGWAMYTWDTELGYFRKICEEESMDNSVSDALLRQYVKNSTFESAMSKLNDRFVTIDVHNQSVQVLNNAINVNKTNTTRLDNTVNSMKSDVQTASSNASYAKDQVLIIKQMIQDLSIDKVRAELFNMSNQVARVESGFETVTNLIHSLDGTVSVLEVTVNKHSQIIAATTNSIKIIEASLNELKQDIITRDDEILRLAKAYTNEKCRGGGINTNAVRQIVHEEIPDYETVRNKAENARNIHDLKIYKKDFVPTKTDTFGVLDWTGKWTEYNKETKETIIHDVKSTFVGNTEFNIGTDEEPVMIPLTNAWEVSANQPENPDLYENYGTFITGLYNPDTDKREFKFYYFYYGDNPISFGEWKLNDKFENDAFSDSFVIDAILPSQRKEDTIASLSDLSSKRDYMDLSYNSGIPFVPNPSKENFNAESWSGVITSANGEKFDIRAYWIPADGFLANRRSRTIARKRMPLKAAQAKGYWRIQRKNGESYQDLDWYMDGDYDEMSYKFTITTDKMTFVEWSGFHLDDDHEYESELIHIKLDVDSIKSDRIALISEIVKCGSPSKWKKISQIEKPVKETATYNQLFDIVMRIIDIAAEEDDSN